MINTSCIKILQTGINENFDLPVSIPDYCESFDLTNTVQATGNIRKRNLNEYKKLEVIDRMETLKEELVDMESIVKEDVARSFQDAVIKCLVSKSENAILK